jgi:hypothetical protein
VTRRGSIALGIGLILLGLFSLLCGYCFYSFWGEPYQLLPDSFLTVAAIVHLAIVVPTVLFWAAIYLMRRWKR